MTGASIILVEDEALIRMMLGARPDRHRDGYCFKVAGQAAFTR